MTDESSAEALCWLRKIKVRQRCNHDARWHNGKGLVDGSEGEASLGMPPTTINALDRLFLIISNPPNGFEFRNSAAFVAGRHPQAVWPRVWAVSCRQPKPGVGQAAPSHLGWITWMMQYTPVNAQSDQSVKQRVSRTEEKKTKRREIMTRLGVVQLSVK